MNTAKISGCIITYNEERNIRRCIESLIPICEEIVVIDSFSTDGTIQICKELGVKVFQHPFIGHIEQKSFALSKCLHDWVISLDADECLTPTLQVSIQNTELKEEKIAFP